MDANACVCRCVVYWFDGQHHARYAQRSRRVSPEKVMAPRVGNLHWLFLCACVWVHGCVCMRMCVCVCVCMCMCVCVCVLVVYVCMCLCMYVFVCVCVYVYTCVLL